MEQKDKGVYWDPKEKVVGVLGLAPQATHDFYYKFVQANPAEKDWEYVRVIMDINTKIPSRGRCLELGEESPVPHMRTAILNLKEAGADFVVIPCNTAHYFYDDVVKDLGVPVLNIIEETYKYIMKQSPGIRCVGLLAARNTVKFKMYERHFDKEGVEILTPRSDQEAVYRAIETVKTGRLDEETRKEMMSLCEEMVGRGAQGIILGCTEISLIINDGDISIPPYDSNRILAEAAVKKAKNLTFR